jgi:RHS repeat-associated protein
MKARVVGLGSKAMKHIERPTLALAALLAVTPVLSAQEAVKYVHLDAIGNVRAVSDQSNAVVERHDYLPYGEEWCPGPPAGVCGSVPPGQSRRFTGKERDQETGLDYFGARYYGARIARFTTTDPVYTWQENILDTQKWNRYAYGRNNPLRYFDPDGRDAVWVKQANGTAILVIPVTFSGSDATDANVAAIVAKANSVTVLDPNVSIQVIATDEPIKGKLNRLDFSPGLDTKLCGAPGECVNERGGNSGHINSSNADAVEAAKHDIFHFAGIRDRYKELDPDEQGRRRTEPMPGYTNSNAMSSRGGTELNASQLQEAKQNRSTKKCSGEGAQCR